MPRRSPIDKEALYVIYDSGYDEAHVSSGTCLEDEMNDRILEADREPDEFEIYKFGEQLPFRVEKKIIFGE